MNTTCQHDRYNSRSDCEQCFGPQDMDLVSVLERRVERLSREGRGGRASELARTIALIRASVNEGTPLVPVEQHTYPVLVQSERHPELIVFVTGSTHEEGEAKAMTAFGDAGYTVLGFGLESVGAFQDNALRVLAKVGPMQYAEPLNLLYDLVKLGLVDWADEPQQLPYITDAGEKYLACVKRIRRDEARPGMVFCSSHGYKLLITEVKDNAQSRSDERHVGIIGHIHANPERETKNERYPANSMITVLV